MRRGLTLLEVLVVLVIIGLLAGLVAPQILGRVGDARATAARTQVQLLATALDGYRLDVGSYPTEEQGLAALVERPTRPPVPATWRGPYLRGAVPVDPWGRPYEYRVVAGGYELRSLGRDGVPGGTGEDADVVAR